MQVPWWASVPKSVRCGRLGDLSRKAIMDNLWIDLTDAQANLQFVPEMIAKLPHLPDFVVSAADRPQYLYWLNKLQALRQKPTALQAVIDVWNTETQAQPPTP